MANTNTAATGLRTLERELVCFICTEVLYQPLTVIDCLHTFCGSCLKEWFSHQHRKASSSRSSSSSSNPYTCPTCRASVKDVQRMAFVNTLLEMFLAENPDSGRSEEDKAEMRKIYQPGEDILPKVERRRERRPRREEDRTAHRERRQIEEATERSLRDMQTTHVSNHTTLGVPVAPANNSRSASREREERRQRRRERERQRMQETSVTEVTSDPTGEITHVDSASPPVSSPRHPDAVEARQRERTMVHQASLRSLVSASENSTGTGDSLDEARIMQEILAEGLLDGIDVESLTEAEQDIWAERIAEAYRQRHPRRSGPRSPPQGSTISSGDSVSATVGDTLHPQPSESDGRRRSSSHQRANTTPSPRRESENREGPRPARTFPPQSTNTMPTSSVVITHRRRDSSQTRQRSTSQSNDRSGSPTHIPPTSRSSVDVSSRQQEGDSIEGGRAPRLSAGRRSSTEPREVPRASELWAQAGGETRRQQLNGVKTTASPSHSPRPAQAVPRAEFHPETTADQASGPSTESSRTVADIGLGTPATSLQAVTQYDEPSSTCYRCKRPNIQYELHRHCNSCNVDLCMNCYRRGQGCLHWYGFGHSAMTKFESSKTTNEATELPHVLFGRQYKRPDSSNVLQSRPSVNGSESVPIRTTSNPASRLCEGHFCDRCGSFANNQFWLCDICNEGEWGFCEECVHTHHCCLHHLLPVAYEPRGQTNATVSQPTASELSVNPTSSELLVAAAQPSPNHSRPPSARSMASSAMGNKSGYINLVITTRCDICEQPIPPTHLRFHCPSHPTPTTTNPNSAGDYDICTYCYHNLIKTRKMKPENGPAGWRQCPSGHRMIILSFDEEDDDGGMRRVVKHDLVGGWKMTEEDMRAWSQVRMQQQASGSPAHSPPLPGTSRGTWSWREDAASTRRATRARTSTLTHGQQQQQSGPSNNASSSATLATSLKLPPDGGFGLRAAAQWSYYPEAGEDGEGELMFPRGAEIAEIEDVNGDWWSGVYAGDIGVLPSGYVKEI